MASTVRIRVRRGRRRMCRAEEIDRDTQTCHVPTTTGPGSTSLGWFVPSKLRLHDGVVKSRRRRAPAMSRCPKPTFVAGCCNWSRPVEVAERTVDASTMRHRTSSSTPARPAGGRQPIGVTACRRSFRRRRIPQARRTRTDRPNSSEQPHRRNQPSHRSVEARRFQAIRRPPEARTCGPATEESQSSAETGHRFSQKESFRREARMDPELHVPPDLGG